MASTTRTLAHSPETAELIIRITGPIRPDWSNAFIASHPVTITNNVLTGTTPTPDMAGRIRTEDDGVTMVLTQRSYPVPADHPWFIPADATSADG